MVAWSSSLRLFLQITFRVSPVHKSFASKKDLLNLPPYSPGPHISTFDWMSQAFQWKHPTSNSKLIPVSTIWNQSPSPPKVVMANTGSFWHSTDVRIQRLCLTWLESFQVRLQWQSSHFFTDKSVQWSPLWSMTLAQAGCGYIRLKKTVVSTKGDIYRVLSLSANQRPAY